MASASKKDEKNNNAGEGNVEEKEEKDDDKKDEGGSKKDGLKDLNKKVDSMLSLLERQQKNQMEIDDRLRKIEKIPRKRPEDFEEEFKMDLNVPKEASRIFRSVLGNEIKLEGVDVEGTPGMRLKATIPEKYHTKNQYGDYHLQRTEEKIDENTGKVISRKIVNYIKPDIRTKHLSANFGSNMLKEVEEWATYVRDNILKEFSKAKEEEPNFFN